MDERTNFIAVASLGAERQGNDNAFKNSNDVANGLARLLVMTRSLCHQSHYYQWQASEPEFSSLHSLFEQHYQSLRKAVDIIANRITELGYELPNQFTKPAWRSVPNDIEILKSMILKHRLCACEARALAIIADNAGDGISAHIASQRDEMHNKSDWFLTTLTESTATHSVM